MAWGSRLLGAAPVLTHKPRWPLHMAMGVTTLQGTLGMKATGQAQGNF